jgi:hypothetical protein
MLQPFPPPRGEKSRVPAVSFNTAIDTWGAISDVDYGTEWRAWCRPRREEYDETLQIDTHTEIQRVRDLNRSAGCQLPISIADIGCGNGLYLLQVEAEQRARGFDDIQTVGFAVTYLPNNLRNFRFGTANPQFHAPANTFDLVVAWQAPIVDSNSGLLENVLYDSLRIARPDRLVAMEQLEMHEWAWFERFRDRISTVCEKVEMGISIVPSKHPGSEHQFKRPVIRMTTFADPLRKNHADKVITQWCLENFEAAERAEQSLKSKA